MVKSELDRLLIAVNGSRLAQACYDCREWLVPLNHCAVGPGEYVLSSGETCVDPVTDKSKVTGDTRSQGSAAS